MAEIEGINRVLIDRSIPRLYNLRKDLWQEYTTILYQEEAFWFHQARSKWLKHGVGIKTLSTSTMLP